MATADKRSYASRIKFLAFLLVLTTTYHIGFCQYRNHPIQLLNENDGLPDDVIYKIFQDTQGYIWLGTGNGLARYDGYSFHKYRHQSHQNNSINDNWVQQIEEDQLGNIWVGTHNGGLSKLDIKTDRFINFSQVDSLNSALKSTIIWGLYLDKKNKLWVGGGNGLEVISPETNQIFDFRGKDKLLILIDKRTINSVVEHNDFILLTSWGSGLIVYDRKTGQSSRFKKDKKNGSITANKLKDIVIYNDSIAYISSQEAGINKLNLNTWKFEQVDLGANTYSFISSIVKDKQNRLWLGSQRKGLILFDPLTKTQTHFLHKPGVSHSLPDNWVPDLLIDKSKQLWIATGMGLCRTNTLEFGFSNFQLDRVRTKHILNEVRCLEYVDSAIWLGTNYGGIVEFDPKTQEFYNEHSDHLNTTLKNNNVWCMTNGEPNDVWIGTGQGLHCYNTKTKALNSFYSKNSGSNSLPYNNISSLYFDGKELWVGTWGGGFSIFTPETNIFENYSQKETKSGSNTDFVAKIYKDSKGRVWIGTFGKGLSIFDRASKTFKNFHYKEGDISSIPNNNIEDINESSNGVIWIATDGGGICYYDEINNRFTTLSEKNGLSDNKTQRIIVQNDSTIWASTDKGLNRVNTHSKRVEIFSKQNGLINEKFSKAYLQEKDGTFWVSTMNGIVHVEPKKIKTYPYNPPLRISHFKRFNKTELLSQNINENNALLLSHNDYVISFDFSALDFRAPDKNRYAYFLDGLNKDWIQLENEHSVTFPALPAGDYTLHIKGTNAEGKWSLDELTLPITVSGPFYLSLSFFILITIVIIIVTTLTVHMRTKRLEILRTRLQRQVSRRTKELETEKIKVEEYSKEVEIQRDFATQQHDKIVAQTKELTDSIIYAERIQKGLFPDFSLVQHHFKNAFLYFKPRDIVSGDFYWCKQQEDYLYLAAVDCTGHGVPGAFMSVLGISFMNDILKGNSTPSTAQILEELRTELIYTLSKGSQQQKIREGMDLSLIRINVRTLELQFSGAYNPLYIIRRGPIPTQFNDRYENSPTYNYTLSEYKGQRIPIGQSEKQRSKFETKTVQLQKGDRLYLFTDGYTDQMNEKMTRKYYAKTLKNKLLEMQPEPIISQIDIINQEHNNWKGAARQIDDILLIGLEV